MLSEEGKISFTGELLDLVDGFLAEYQRHKGPLRDGLERNLVISYVLGAMCCELNTIWDCLSKAPLFGSLHPRVIFQECQDKNSTAAAAFQAAVEKELRRRGWLPADSGRPEAHNPAE